MKNETMHTPSTATHPTNPFAVSSDDKKDQDASRSISSDVNNESFVTTRLGDANSSLFESPGKRKSPTKTLNQSIVTDVSQISISPSLFPSTLSSWMDDDQQNHYSPIADGDTTCDEESFHDCISIEDQETDVLNESTRSTLSDHAASKLMDSNHSSTDDTINEATSLLPKSQHDHETPLMANNSIYRQSYHATSPTPITSNINNDQKELSPLQDALCTWLSPYAQSARKAGRRLLSFEDKEDDTTSETSLHKSNGSDGVQDAASGFDQHNESASNGSNRNVNSVQFQPEHTEHSYKRDSSLFSRVASSPALITKQSYQENVSYPISSLERGQINHDTIVLKDIEANQNPNEDGSVMHPWTRLILLEELGTASSWTIILLPYAFMILALFLDGDARLKNEIVGPLRGKNHCIDVVGGEVAEPFGVSVKGYFPMPFSYKSTGGNETWNNETEACTYPFELREGVGILSHGMEFTSIVDAKYRFLMSHGYAFTSGLIPDVPATSQSLIGKATFSNLSSRAVGLVASGGIVTSSIVFQRKTIEENGNCTDNNTGQNDSNTEDRAWSPVLILSPKRLDLRCTLDEIDDEASNTSKPVTWDCIGNMFEAFFSLPNAALLVGGDIRVGTLLSYHRQHNSLDTDDFWYNEMDSVGLQTDDFHRLDDDFYQSQLDLLKKVDLSNPSELLTELLERASFTIHHQSKSYTRIVEVIRIIALVVTFSFSCYWSWSMGYEDTDKEDESNLSPQSRAVRLKAFIGQTFHSVYRSWKKNDEDQLYYFWWESPWLTFPERRYLLSMLLCLLFLQNPLLAYAFFNPTVYSSARFRCLADSLSGMSIHGMLFLWLCLMHGLRYHTADFSRRRYEQYKRVIELEQATQHISPPSDLEQNKWGRIKWYYKQYGDIFGGGVFSSSLRHKHDLNADSFVEFIIPKMMLLVLGVISTVTAAIFRFPGTEVEQINHPSSFLDPDTFGGKSQLYVFSSIMQIIVIQSWGIMIMYTSFVTGERLRREPFLSTRPAQLTFRVLTSIVLLGFVISITLFALFTLSVFGYSRTKAPMDGSVFVFDTSVGSEVETWDTKADVLLRFIRQVSTKIPYVDTSFNIGGGKILYATATTLVGAYIYLPSSHFRKSDNPIGNDDTEINILSYKKEDLLWVKDKMLQGTDKRFVVTLCKYTHTWRIFPLPIRSHGLMSQHTIKESLNLIGTFQLDGGFGMYRFKNGRGNIFKGRYIPVFCVEIACWLLEASWQSYYSPTEYLHNDWAPGKMNLASIGLKLERAIEDEETDTHAYVATNASEQVEGEEDSIIVVSFRGTASISNMKTDLSFRQVPLPAKLCADNPSFNIKPGKGMEIQEAAWDVKKTPRSIIKQILYPSTFPTAVSANNLHSEDDETKSNLLPAVTDGAKAIIRAMPMARQALPCVHEGFLHNYLKVRQEIIETILEVLQRQVDKAVERSRFSESSCLFLDPEPITLPKIYVTGHSLGGGLAQLLALDLASNCEIVIQQIMSPSFSFDHDDFNLRQLPSSVKSSNLIRLRPPIAVYTYGQPRVGNLAFKAIYKQRVPHTFRVVAEGDAFTSMPTLSCFGGIYRHAGLEVLLDEGCTGNILVGPTVVETLLRFTKVRTSVANHSLAKYRDSLESALEKDDLKEYYQSHSGKVKHYEDNLPSWVINARKN